MAITRSWGPAGLVGEEAVLHPGRGRPQLGLITHLIIYLPFLVSINHFDVDMLLKV